MLRRFCAFAALVTALLLAPAAAQAAVSAVGSASINGTGSASAQLTVQPGANRILVVGISTLESADVTSVTYGAQVLTRELASAKDSSRAEVWTLTAPNPGTANVTVNVTGNAPLVIGATSFTGVDQTLPILGANSQNENNGSNSASLVLNATVADDGMFGVISINDAPNITAINSTPSTDTVAGVKRWSGAQNTVIGAGATRGGNTGQNMALNAGINWFWNRIDPSHLMPYSNIIVALRQATTSAPVVISPIAHTITHDSATLSGSVADTGGEAVTQRGVVYCTGVCTPVIGGAGVTERAAGAGDTGPFSIAITGLTPSTTYTFRAYATNAKGTSYTASAPFTTAPQPNRAPTANAGGPYTIDEGGSLALNGSATDADGDTLTYAWELDGDNDFDDVVGATPTLTRAQLAAFGLADGPVTRSIRLGVSDGERVTLSNPTTLTVANVAPTATVTAPASVVEGGSATVSFSDQADPADSSFTYAYDFDGNGSFELTNAPATASVPASLLADGPTTRSVRAAIRDKDGGETVYTKTITVTDAAPTAKLADVTTSEGSTATIKLTDVADVAADQPGLRFAYDLDDDGTFETTNSTSTEATLPAALTADGPGTRTVHARVSDKDGGTSTYTAKVTVDNVAPTAKLTGATVDEGTPATVAFSDQDDVSAADKVAGFTYEFDLDDDGVFEVKGADPTATLKTVDGPATLPVKGAIVDRDGARRQYTTTVTVRNAAPTVTVTGTGSATAGQAYALTVTGADAGGDALTGTVNWGDGTTDASAATLSHTYGAAGAYTVAVTLRDEDGSEVTATHAVSVAAAPAPPAAPAPTAAATPAPSAGSGVLGVEATNLTISSVRVTPRCIRATGLKAVTSAAKTIKVQFRVSAAADVTFRLTRQTEKGGASKCPPSTGVAQKGGRKVPGVYSPFSNRAVKAKTGLNTVTVAATAGKGKALKPGTYLLTITAGGVSARTKVWVLAQ